MKFGWLIQLKHWVSFFLNVRFIIVHLFNSNGFFYLFSFGCFLYFLVALLSISFFYSFWLPIILLLLLFGYVLCLHFVFKKNNFYTFWESIRMFLHFNFNHSKEQKKNDQKRKRMYKVASVNAFFDGQQKEPLVINF